MFDHVNALPIQVGDSFPKQRALMLGGAGPIITLQRNNGS